MYKKIINKIKSSIVNSQWSINSGFTLIELLVVVAIIGILSALLMSNFIAVRQRARDAQRKSDTHQIQSALELYRSDWGSYPATNALSTCGKAVSFKSPDNNSTYLQSVPCDPTTGSPYTYSSTGTTYTLITCLENTNDSQKDSSNNSSACGTTLVSYTLNNP